MLLNIKRQVDFNLKLETDDGTMSDLRIITHHVEKLADETVNKERILNV